MELKPAAPRSLWCDNVVEMETSRRSGVTSAWLSNGVRVHHLKLDRHPGEVVVTIALSGGKLLEDAATRGITEVAAGVLDDWDTAALEQSLAREKMQGRDLRIDAGASQDALTVRLAGAAADLDAGLRVVHALLTNPKVTEESVRQSKEKVIRELRQRAGDSRAAVSDAINSALLGPAGGAGGGGGVDPRLEAPREQAVQAMSVEQIRGWISRHIKEDGAPIEVAFVGDVALADALRLADGTLGTLPKRARVDAHTDGAARIVAKPALAAGVDRKVESAGVSPGKVTLVRGFFGPEMSELDDQRALRAAARVAVSRLKARLVPPRFSIGPNDPGGGVYVSAFQGLGMALVTATVEASQAPDAMREIDEELDRLAQTPPTEPELEPVAGDLAKSVEEFEHDPRYWSEALARCDAIGITPDDIASGSVFYKSLKPEQVRDAMKKYRVKDRLIGLTIRGPAVK